MEMLRVESREWRMENRWNVIDDLGFPPPFEPWGYHQGGKLIL
jgi:hypothetical protein